MKPELWSKIEAICQQVLNVPESEREAYLNTVCRGDDSLYEQVSSLLEFSDSTLLDDPAVSLSADVLTQPSSQKPINRIGAYRLIRTIATGGMGEVYLAARDDESFDQYVAIKVIRKEMISDDLLIRFYEERQILASLNHPSIGRLFDGGTTHEGLPWFAMEYVEGVPVTEYCRKYSLTADERLQLFLKICSAVQYAHQNMVIHHDLKPGNILVDRDGNPKLLDFGISKLLSGETGAIHKFTDLQEATDSAGVTAIEESSGKAIMNAHRMTPEYASPEQVFQHPVSAASDVYSLGALLYELLTDQLPHNFQDRTPEQIKQQLKTGAVDAPSAVSQNKRVAADLDAIALKALATDPSDRYGTVEQLSVDIKDYRAIRPVSAIPDTFSYRSGKFLRRNRWTVTAAGLITCLVVGFSVITFIQSMEIEARAIEAEQQRDRVERISDFLVGLFESADPSQAQNRDITAVELLNRGVLQIENDMSEQPQFQADLYLVIADVYESLGLFDQAEDLAGRSLAISSGLHTASHPDIASALNSLGWIHFRKGDLNAADSLLVRTLSMRETLFGSQDPEVARALNDLAVIRQARGDLAGTDSLLSRALDMRILHYGDTNESVAITMSNYAALKWALGDLQATEELMRSALDVLKANAENGESMRVAVAMTNLAAVLLTQGQYDESEELYRQALDIRYRLVGEEHPDVAYSLAHLGNLLRIQGELVEAEPLLSQALELRQQLLGARHLSVADSYRTLALLFDSSGDTEQAENSYLASIDIYREAFPDGHTQTAEVLYLLGSLYFNDDRLSDAEPLLREAYELRMEGFGENDSRTVESGQRLGLVQAALADLQ